MPVSRQYPFPSKENRHIPETDDLGPPVVLNQLSVEMSVGVLLDVRQAQVVERDKKVQVCGARWCTRANMRVRQLMGRNNS